MRLLDLFCGAGGASMGYKKAGFDEIVGVDKQPQPHYPFEFVQADALEFCELYGWEFDAIHASPPCQAFTPLAHMIPASKKINLIPQTRKVVMATGRPYVIENVTNSGLKGIVLCGLMFGQNAFRHRVFESNLLLLQPSM